MLLLQFLVVIVFQLNNYEVRCWRFDVLGLDEGKIELARIAIYNLRAFLAIPRVYDEQPVTLVEVPWPERSFYTIFNTKPFPNGKSQDIGDCRKIQSVVSLDIQKDKGRLYVLDKGFKDLCVPKIIVFDVYTNKEILQTELKGVPADNLNALTIIDLNPVNRDVRVIIGDAGSSSLLMYNLSKNTWWRLSMTSHFEFGYSFSSDELTRNYGFNQLALSRKTSTLYATSSQAPELYSINLNELMGLEEPLPVYCNWYEYNGTEIPVQYVGNKFGKSVGLFANFLGNLFYVYERDNVILKWSPSKPFVTENMEVVLQNYSSIPNAIQIFAEPPRQLWVLNSKRNEEFAYIVKLKTTS